MRNFLILNPDGPHADAEGTLFADDDVAVRWFADRITMVTKMDAITANWGTRIKWLDEWQTAAWEGF